MARNHATPWSALTCQRFGLSQPGTGQSGDRSPHSKELSCSRTFTLTLLSIKFLQWRFKTTNMGAPGSTSDPGDTIIPRNYGRGSEFFGVNLRFTKEFGFGGGEKGATATAQGGGGGRKNLLIIKLLSHGFTERCSFPI